MNKSKRCYVDVHVLQTVPPSCVNRDDTGSPKTAIYGGTTRARVSSQAWKKASRAMFSDFFDDAQLGERTKKIVAKVAEEIAALDANVDAEKLAIKALEQAGLKIKDAAKGTDALFFISTAQAKALATLAVEGCKEKKTYHNALKENPSVDIALFGRMVADDPSLNYDAAAQVAHSISTHTVHNEYDYFTAVDDRAPEDNAGAGHLGTVEFNSATLYRYATVNITELTKTLGKEAPHTARAFAEAFIRSMPTGKQNTFANRTLPDCVYITMRADQPVNLCGAFEKPVISRGGYAEPSARRLEEYAGKIYANFAEAPQKAWATGDLEIDAVILPLTAVLDELETYLKQLIDDCEVE